MPMQNLKSRTKQFALRIIHLCNALEKSGGSARVIGKQLIRSGTSANGHINLSH